MALEISDDVEVWGEPTSALPTRPVHPDDLEPLAEHQSTDELRVPSTGAVIGTDAGPVITSSSPGLISEFLLKKDGKTIMFRYGWPEVVEGELAVPEDQSLAKSEGYISWWRNEIEIGDETDTDEMMDSFFDENTTPLLGE